MVYIFTALQAEAKPLISRLVLKKAGDPERFPVWISADQKFMLSVTGPGPVPAAIAAASVLALHPPGPADHILNIGICAGLGVAQPGECYLCASIAELYTGKRFYPDLLWKHPFPEAALCTGSRILRDPGDSAVTAYLRDDLPLLYDMEAAAICQACAAYAGPHQMSFLKIVSDHGDGNFPSAWDVRGLVEKHLPAVLQYMENLPGSAAEPPALPMLEQLSEDLHCSVSMKHMLQQYLTYAALSVPDFEEKIRQLYADGILPCKDRKEGKKILEQFREFLL